MGVSIYRAIMGLQRKADGVFSGQDTPCPYTSSMLLKYLYQSTMVKILQCICMLLVVFTCTDFCPKPFAAKGFRNGTVCMPISTPCKTPFLLKPFNYAHLAVSQFGMRHPKAVSHCVSFLGSNVMDIWAWAQSHSGNMRQVNRCLILSHFLQRDLTTFLKLSNLCTMYHQPCTTCQGCVIFVYSVKARTHFYLQHYLQACPTFMANSLFAINQKTMKLSKVLLAFASLMIGTFLPACNQNKSTDNILTEQEKNSGWALLFDGKTTDGWHLYNKGKRASNWVADSNQLVCNPHLVKTAHDDLVTDSAYANFDLKFDWKISIGGNSGVFINVQEDTAYGTPWVTGPEYQLLDNENSVDHNHNDTLRQAGCLYSLTALKNHASAKPYGQWNTSRILQQNGQVTFWLNGVVSAQEDLNSARWKQLVAGSNLGKFPDFGKFTKGKIALQDWNKGVAFRNIKIKALP